MTRSPAKIAPRERFVDDDRRARRGCAIVTREVAPVQEPHPHRRDEAGRHAEVNDCIAVVRRTPGDAHAVGPAALGEHRPCREGWRSARPAALRTRSSSCIVIACVACGIVLATVPAVRPTAPRRAARSPCRSPGSTRSSLPNDTSSNPARNSTVTLTAIWTATSGWRMAACAVRARLTGAGDSDRRRP